MSLVMLALALVLGADPPASASQAAAPAQASSLDEMYDPASMATVSGLIVAQHRRTRGPRDLCLVLLTERGTLDVHLGPFDFVDAQPLQLAGGDQVVVFGSLTRVEGYQMMIAQVITRGSERLILRDPSGTPRWPVGTPTAATPQGK
ncbi:MAG: hypothetical protein IPO09_20340 [Anaeromyxobacter sp.]|nr:hypothetical protein [Anaeromyxobacter sp.]MBL0274860.1 hypothetical protein [Anaeromyxobacter sp.]